MSVRPYRVLASTVSVERFFILWQTLGSYKNRKIDIQGLTEDKKPYVIVDIEVDRHVSKSVAHAYPDEGFRLCQ